MGRFLIKELFTAGEINRAAGILTNAKEQHAHQRVIREVVEPALARINKLTKQENDTSYLAYVLENEVNARGNKR